MCHYTTVALAMVGAAKAEGGVNTTYDTVHITNMNVLMLHNMCVRLVQTRDGRGYQLG